MYNTHYIISVYMSEHSQLYPKTYKKQLFIINIAC